MRWPFIIVVLLGLASFAVAQSATMQPGVWKILVQPGARWVLRDTVVEKGQPARSIVVETYDVRKLGSAIVGRLRWTLKVGKTTIEDPQFHNSLPTHLAVTDAGLYLLDAKSDDETIGNRLKGKPSRSDPPKPYKGTAQNQGRYLEIRQAKGGPMVCMGEGPLPGDGDCDDVCFGEMCVSSTAGVVIVEGNWAPDAAIFAQPGFEK